MTLEVAGSELQTEVMDHHGIVAASCQELKIADRINDRIGSDDPRRVIQPGTATVAMIINGLGFTGRRLYLTPQFFQNKALDQFFQEEITADQLDDHALGKALDEISAYGSSKLFAEVAFDIAIEHGLIGKTAHLDTTSFSMAGEYDTEEAAAISVAHGYSKDYRPDLKQVMLSLTMTSPANIPIWQEPLDGNSSDKANFHETIKAVRAFQSQLEGCDDFMWIADSALYTPDKLLSHSKFTWLSRVPENNKESKALLETASESIEWTHTDNGYAYHERMSEFGGIKQRWILVYSEQAYKRESKTFEKRIIKQMAEAEKLCWHAGNQLFACESDALKEAKTIQKKYRYLDITVRTEAVQKHLGRGRPAANTAKKTVGYKLIMTIEKNQKAIDVFLRRKGRFILATNQLNQKILSTTNVLSEYKNQQCVENGFRFLKDPWFMVDSFYIKKRKRIEALMMVMTLCLLVYNFTQHKVRTELENINDTLPNQIGKQIKKPTLKWIFQLMEGISIVKMYNETNSCIRSVITNMNAVRRKIIRLLGRYACEIYGIPLEIAGM